MSEHSPEDKLEPAVQDYPLDAKLIESEDLVFRTMEEHCFAKRTFRDKRIDDDETLQEIAEWAAKDFGRISDREGSAEDFMHGMRCAYALLKVAVVRGGVRLYHGQDDLEDDDDYYPRLMEAVDVYGAKSLAAQGLVMESRHYISRDVETWDMAALGMYTLLYMANAGELGKLKDARANAAKIIQNSALTRYADQLHREGDTWAQSDEQIIAAMEKQFNPPPGEETQPATEA